MGYCATETDPADIAVEIIKQAKKKFPFPCKWDRDGEIIETPNAYELCKEMEKEIRFYAEPVPDPDASQEDIIKATAERRINDWLHDRELVADDRVTFYSVDVDQASDGDK